MLVEVVSCSADKKRSRSCWGGYIRTKLALFFYIQSKKYAKIVFIWFHRTNSKRRRRSKWDKFRYVEVCVWYKSFMATVLKLQLIRETAHSLPNNARCEWKNKNKALTTSDLLWKLNKVKQWWRPCHFIECYVKDYLFFSQLHLWHDTLGNNLIIRVLSARGLSLQHMPSQQLPNLYVLLYLLPNRE